VWGPQPQAKAEAEANALPPTTATAPAASSQLFSTGGDYYRKPCGGMWYLFAAKLNGGVPIDLAASLYVGDAAGRLKVRCDAVRCARGARARCGRC